MSQIAVSRSDLEREYPDGSPWAFRQVLNRLLTPPITHLIQHLGLPHATQENDSWNGYYIPKGTVVNFNIGFMMKDPRTWGPDAQEFKPERFLKEDSNKLPDVLSLVFGFGKRYAVSPFP